MDINDLTLGQIKELQGLFSQPIAAIECVAGELSDGLCEMVGQKVIVRTDRAGVFFGTLSQKSGREVIVINARRMWQWHAKEGISLSAVAVLGVSASKSRITGPVEKIWLEAIEIIPCSATAVGSIEGCEHATAG